MAIKYFTESINGKPYLLARVEWPHVSDSMSQSNPKWTHMSRATDMAYSSDGDSVTTDEAQQIANEWGGSLD